MWYKQSGVNMSHAFVDTASIQLQMRGNPFDIEIPNGCGFVFRMDSGVMKVYPNEESLQMGKPTSWPCADLPTFLADQNSFLTLISDGPL